MTRPLTPSVPFSGMRQPLRDVLSRMVPDARRIHRTWRRLLRAFDPDRTTLDRLADVNLLASYRHLLSGSRAEGGRSDEQYRLAIGRDAMNLIRSGVGEDLAIAAIALHLEASLVYARRPAECRALTRLTSTTQRLVVERYREEWMADQRRADDQERQKLSRDLHDEVGADLVVLKLYVEMIAVELAKGRIKQVGPKLQEALLIIAHSIESVRRLSLDLGPAYLDSLGFLPALRSVVRQFARRTGIKGELKKGRTPKPLPPSHEVAVYRVLLGALSNVAKHSKARHVTVTVSTVGRDFRMTVQDDGRGFDIAALRPERSFGITAMRERVRALNGRFRIESWTAPRRGVRPGTRIAVSLPAPTMEGP